MATAAASAASDSKGSDRASTPPPPASSSASGGAGAGAGAALHVTSVAQHAPLTPPIRNPLTGALMTSEELLAELEKERRHSSVLKSQLKRLQEATVRLASQSEIEEEFIANKLMKSLRQVKEEKDRLATEVDAEEEYLTSRLQSQLKQLQRDKIDVESRMEQENEYIMNKLQRQINELASQKAHLQSQLTELHAQAARSPSSDHVTKRLQRQLDKLQHDKITLENQLEAEQEFIVNKMQRKIDQAEAETIKLQRRMSGDLGSEASELAACVSKLKLTATSDTKPMLERLSELVAAVTAKCAARTSERDAAQQRAKELERNVEALRTANFVLTQRLEDAREQLTARQSETSQWANSMEADAERHFNVLTRNPAGAAAAASEGRRRASSVEGVLTPLGASTRLRRKSNSGALVRSPVHVPMAPGAGGVPMPGSAPALDLNAMVGATSSRESFAATFSDADGEGEGDGDGADTDSTANSDAAALAARLHRVRHTPPSRRRGSAPDPSRRLLRDPALADSDGARTAGGCIFHTLGSSSSSAGGAGGGSSSSSSSGWGAGAGAGASAGSTQQLQPSSASSSRGPSPSSLSDRSFASESTSSRRVGDA